MLQGVTKYHKMLQNVTKCHKIWGNYRKLPVNYRKLPEITGKLPVNYRKLPDITEYNRYLLIFRNLIPTSFWN